MTQNDLERLRGLLAKVAALPLTQHDPGFYAEVDWKLMKEIRELDSALGVTPDSGALRETLRKIVTRFNAWRETNERFPSGALIDAIVQGEVALLAASPKGGEKERP